jgi:hypothetical protein
LLENLDPSVVSPVNDDETTTLMYLLGLEYEVGLEFLVSTGLLKHGTKNALSLSAVQDQWDNFILEGNLTNIGN